MAKKQNRTTILVAFGPVEYSNKSNTQGLPAFMLFYLFTNLVG